MEHCAAMQKLESYVEDRWTTGDGDAVPLLNPATEEVLAETSASGIDMGGALAHARRVGGPALRALTFAERGALLEQMSKALHAEREALIESAIANGGNTRGDAKFDIDGATATLMAYAELGKELGDARALDDGAPVAISGARVGGRHVWLPRHGAAIHIGAFNFPAWGWAEKAACALLAGMPVVTKPAAVTALVAWQSVRAVVAAKILPAGALSFICGEPGDLLEHVQWNDVVAFTGSSETGRKIRAMPSVLDAGVPVNVEADSLNAAVLFPDAKDETVDAFLRDVVRDMTQKAGQKCTAMRRVLVPEGDLERIAETLADRLSEVTVGNPAEKEVRMGPVSTAAQQERVQEGLRRLKDELDIGWQPRPFEPVGVPAGKGFFVPAMLMVHHGDRGEARLVHELEVFGPVVTLLPYDGETATAVDVVRRGRGGLVCSLYGDDRTALGEALEGLLPWHGRVTVCDAKVADKMPPPGTVLPQLLHGGPGRAGGGTELGGPRGMELYLQRSAVQGNAPLLGKLLLPTQPAR